LDEDKIEQEVDALRTKLLANLSVNPAANAKNLKSHDTHALAAAKKVELDRMAKAFGTRDDYVEGDAFNKEKQEEIRKRRIVRFYSRYCLFSLVLIMNFRFNKQSGKKGRKKNEQSGKRRKRSGKRSRGNVIGLDGGRKIDGGEQERTISSEGMPCLRLLSPPHELETTIGHATIGIGREGGAPVLPVVVKRETKVEIVDVNLLVHSLLHRDVAVDSSLALLPHIRYHAHVAQNLHHPAPFVMFQCHLLVIIATSTTHSIGLLRIFNVCEFKW
jgi:hypothetical protein